MQENNSIFYNLSKVDSNLLKAFSIFFVVFHNYMHWISAVGENEMNFVPERVYNYINGIITYPSGIVASTLTFLGHYGVLLFVFISAYGLTKRQMKIGKEPYLKYLIHRLVKIYALMAAGFVFYILFVYYQTGEWIYWKKLLIIVKHFLLMEGNFNHTYTFAHIGPWWFFGMIIQFYFLFPLLYYIARRYGQKGCLAMIAVAFVIIYVLYFANSRGYSIFPVFANVWGHLPEFILGIMLALFPKIMIDWKKALAALLVFVPSLFFEAVFPLSFFTSLIIILFTVKPLLMISKDTWFIKAMTFIGQMSMFIFLTNGLIRGITIHYAYAFLGGGALGSFVGLFIHTVIVFAVSAVMYFAYKWIARPIKKYTGLSIL